VTRTTVVRVGSPGPETDVTESKNFAIVLKV
jgi:hypothetical protein